MPRIERYYAPKERVQPSNAGYNAFEQAGRRLGSMYGEVARSEIDASKLAGQEQYSAIEWPYVLSSLIPTSAALPGTANVKVANGGRSSGTGFGEEVFPNLSAENSAASATLGETPATGNSSGGNALKNYTSSMNDLYNSYGLNTAPGIGQAGYVGPNAAAEASAQSYAKSLDSAGTASVPTGGDTSYNIGHDASGATTSTTVDNGGYIGTPSNGIDATPSTSDIADTTPGGLF